MTTKSYSARRVARDEASYRDLVATVRSAPNGELADVERAIASFEQQYGISSVEARARLERGELSPTLEVEGWMMALKVRDHLVSVKARTR